MTTDKMMLRMGFSPKANGPYVSELRAKTAEQVANGLVSTSAGTWDRPYYEIDEETRARARLAMEWELSRGHSYRVECIDPVIFRQFNARTMKSKLVVRWHMLPAWLGDRQRELGMRLRKWRDRKLVNPYSHHP